MNSRLISFFSIRKPKISVSSLLADIVGKVPSIDEEPEEDHKILVAAHHIAGYKPEPLASPNYVRKNTVCS